MTNAERIIKTYQKLATKSLRHKNKIEEITSYFQPERYYNKEFEGGENREKIFDSTPEDALDTFAAFTHSLFTPSTQMWSTVGVSNINEADLDTESKEWLDFVSRGMSDTFNEEKLAFHNHVQEFYHDTPGQGTGIFFVDEVEGKPRFECLSSDNVEFTEDYLKNPNTLYRTINMTAAQVVERFGSEAGVQIKEIAEKEPLANIEIIHAIEKRKKFKEDAIRGKDMLWASFYISKTTTKILSESGYREQPFMICRFSKNSGKSAWGVGLGHKALPDARVLNAMNRSALIAGEKQADPVTLLPHDGWITDYGSDGGTLNYYRSSIDNMKDKVITMGSQADLNALSMFIDKRQSGIKKMFINDKILEVGGPQKTATEVLENTKARMNVLSPVSSRYEPEFLGPLMSRVFRIKYRNGDFGEAPAQLRNADLKITYISPIARAQKQVDAEAFQMAMNFLSPIVAIHQPILRLFNFDEVARDTQVMFGYPAKYIKDPKVVEREDAVAAEARNKESQMNDAGRIADMVGKSGVNINATEE